MMRAPSRLKQEGRPLGGQRSVGAVNFQAVKPDISLAPAGNRQPVVAQFGNAGIHGAHTGTDDDVEGGVFSPVGEQISHAP